MIYPKNFEQKIGFDIIRKSIQDLCICPLGKSWVDHTSFSDDYEKIEEQLLQTEEFRQILLSSNRFPTDHYYDITDSLNKVAIEGTYMETETLFNLKRSLNTLNECIEFFKKDKENKYPVLNHITLNVVIDKAIVQQLNHIIDDKGKIRDQASPELTKIRQQLISKQTQVRKKIVQLIQTAQKNGWSPENMEMTVRNGRVVIPVIASYKKNINGFIHDESSTGQTVFIEPAVVFELNNDIRDLESAEKREIIRILTDFTDFIRPSIEAIKDCFHFLGLMDFIRAKAVYALKIDACKPLLRQNPIINWSKARHPLLLISHKIQKKEVVPLDILLTKTSRILIISGPNAGGKSVCLKTVGLIQYMLQCGLLVPINDYSESGIFSNIFIDIGDEQSLENDLSTYSSHLLSMKYFIEKGDNKTLFLIDEFGAGTEPQIGGAIAEAILENLNNKNAMGVITTHYANLKLLDSKMDGIINGAMLFDSDNMKPLYVMQAGKPGSSFAFEIAHTIGLPDDILSIAKKIAGVKQVSFDKQLQDLDVQKIELDKKETQYKMADHFLSELIQKYQDLTEELEKSKKNIISQAKQQAFELLEETNKRIENTIKEIKETQADKTKTKELRDHLDTFKQNIKVAESDKIVPIKSNKEKKKIRFEKTKEIKILKTPIEKGDHVRIIGQESIGEVIGLDAKNVYVMYGSAQLKTTLAKLEKISPDDVKKQPKSNTSISAKIHTNFEEKIKHFKLTLDIRGMRVDEALTEVQHYLDDAVLLAVTEIRILHGKGNGVLRHLVHNYLRNIPEVKRFADESIEKGGHGITIIYFK